MSLCHWVTVAVQHWGAGRRGLLAPLKCCRYTNRRRWPNQCPSSQDTVIVNNGLTWQGFTAFCWRKSLSGYAESLEHDTFSSISLCLGKYFYFVLFFLQFALEFVTRHLGWGTITEQNSNTYTWNMKSALYPSLMKKQQMRNKTVNKRKKMKLINKKKRIYGWQFSSWKILNIHQLDPEGVANCNP